MKTTTYGKIDENNKVTLCPRNGSVNGKYISNLERYFNDNPDVAKNEGYYPVIFLEKNCEKTKFEKKRGKIYEVEINEEGETI